LYLLQYKVQYRVLIDVSRFNTVTQQQNGFSESKSLYKDVDILRINSLVANGFSF